MSEKFTVEAESGQVRTEASVGEACATAEIPDEKFFSPAVIRRNMFFLILMDVVFMTGGPDMAIALSPLLVYLKASNMVIGIIQGATFAGLIGMFLSPWITRRFRIKKWYMTVANTPYVWAVGILGLGIIMSGRLGMSNSSLIVFVLVMMLSHYFFAGFVALPHQEYIVGCIPKSHRGRLAGLSSSIGSIGAMASSAVCGLILLRHAKPMSFGYLFLMSYVLFQSAYLLAVFAKERPAPVEKSPKAWSRDMFRGYWNDRAFFRFSMLCAFTWFTVISANSFIPVYGFRELKMPAVSAALISIINQAIRIPSCVLIGFLSDKIGAKRLLSYWPVGVLLSFLPVLVWRSPFAVYSSLAVWSLAQAIFQTLYMVLVYNLPKPENRPGDMTILLIMQYCVAPIGMTIIGRICDITNYHTVFFGAAISSIAVYFIVIWVSKAMSDIRLPSKSLKSIES